MRKLFSALLVSAFVLGGIMFTSCESGSDSPVINPQSTVQQKIINKKSSKTATELEVFADPNVSVGLDLSALNVAVEPVDARVKVWCDTSIVTLVEEPDEIEGTYLVRFKPKKQGKFTIYAESGSLKKNFEITVSSRVVSIDVTGSSAPIDNGKTVQLTAKKTPASSDATVEWTSTDEEVATVNQSGLVTAKKPGVATIVATVINEESGSLDGKDIVTGYFDVTVKGFYLSDTSFFLCGKDDNDEVEAKIVGITGGTVEWVSSNTSLFNVTPDSSDSKKATLRYVSNAEGEGTLTATLKDGSNVLATATAKVVVSKLYMLALGDSIAAGYALEHMDSSDASMEEPEMLKAYQKYMNRRKDKNIDPDYVSDYCYSSYLYDEIDATENISLHSYAMAGDNTTNLLDKLKPDYRDGTIATKKGEILEAVKQADIITLCIGANDILLKALSSNLITQDAEWFKKTFEKELEGFKGRFETILETLTANEQEVYVMSIYSPYHYFDEQHLPESQLSSFLYGKALKKVVQINKFAEDVLDDMNAYIASKDDGGHVHFVDVAPTFNTKSASVHTSYIHADPEKVDVGKLVRNFGSAWPIWFDPHPTILGTETIGAKFIEAYTVP